MVGAAVHLMSESLYLKSLYRASVFELAVVVAVAVAVGGDMGVVKAEEEDEHLQELGQLNSAH